VDENVGVDVQAGKQLDAAIRQDSRQGYWKDYKRLSVLK
jgi:hypothetical protein